MGEKMFFNKLKITLKKFYFRHVFSTLKKTAFYDDMINDKRK